MSTYKARKDAANKGNFSNLKLLTTSALTAAGLIASGHAAAQVAPDSLPQGAEVTKGSATYDYSDNRLDITQNNRGVTAADYHGGFNIGKDAGVYVDQRTGDIFVHRDTSDNTSHIEGVFEGSASNIVLNKNGVLITGSARIDMHSFAASTADTVTFDGDKATFSDLGDASVEVGQGAEITIADGGVAAFVAPTAKNAGVINAKLGKVVFAAGEEVTVDLYGDGLFEVAVEGELADAYLENTGEINAQGGTVQMTALAAKDVADNIINLDGVVDVSSATQSGGKIVLSGGDAGTVKVAGKLDASGKDGGEINIDAANTIATTDSEIIADGDEKAGHITLWGRKNALYAGSISALGEDGFVETSGGNLGVWGSVSVSAGSEWLLDPTDLVIVGAPVGSLDAAFIPALDDIVFSPEDSPANPQFNRDSVFFVQDALINDALNNGANVTLQTHAGGNNDGNITVRSDAAVEKTGGDESTFRLEAHEDIIVDGTIGASGSSVLNVELIADYDSSGGDADIVINNTVTTNGGDFTAEAADDFDITAAGSIDATGAGGNIAIDQGGVFSSVNPDTLKTNNGGTVTVNQNGGTAGGASIQNAIDAIDNSGTGQNTVFTDSSTYSENLVIDEDNLKIDGDNTVIEGNGVDAVISVEASNFHLDPVTVDAMGAAYGLYANGIGAVGLISGGNTFKNASGAGIYVASNIAGTGDIKNNIFEGSNNRGIAAGFLTNGYTLNITDNTIGSAGDEVFKGIQLSHVLHADVNISGGSINSENDGISLDEGVRDGGTVNITGVNVVSTLDEALDVQKQIEVGGTLNVKGVTFSGQKNGIEFETVSGEMNVGSSDTTTIINAAQNGIDGEGVLGGNLNIINSDIDATRHGVRIATASDAEVNIEDSVITASNSVSRGLLVGSIIDGTEFNVLGTTIGKSDDVIFKGMTIGKVEDATLNVSGGSITSKNDGMSIYDIHSGGTVNVDGGIEITSTRDDAIDVQREILAGGVLNVKDATLNTGKDGIELSLISGTVNVGSSDTTTTINANHDGIMSEALWLGPYENGQVNITNVDIDAGKNGVNLNNVNTSVITNNRITAGEDGIHVRDFNNSWISYNDIINTGDDGIDVKYGNFVSIYENYIDLTGFLSNAPAFGNTEVGDDEADGIHVAYVGGGAMPTLTDTAGPSGSLYGASVEIYDNEIANVSDDGIQVVGHGDICALDMEAIAPPTTYSAYIADNIVGHAGDDGVDVDGMDTTIVRDNKISSVEDKGITIDGGFYAGVFDNRVLLTGNDGIQVENIFGGSEAEVFGDIEYGYGWSVNVSGNEVAFTGDDGIEVRNSGPTLVRKNKVFAAGMGEDLGELIDEINTFASLSFSLPPIFAVQAQLVADWGDDWEEYENTFTWNWDDGHGINVHDISGAYYSPNGWAADIRGNRVKYTGGHGILAEENDRTRIKNNNVQYAGLDYTTFAGVDGASELFSSGPFHRSNPGRRDLWASEDSMIDVIEDYIGAVEPTEPTEDVYVTLTNIGYDNHDGIHAEDIYSYSQEGISEASYLYALKIEGNTVKFTGDDGIEVDGAGRTLIAENKIRDAGHGDNEDYGSGDYYGADGIFVRNVSATVSGEGPNPARSGGLSDVDAGEGEPSELPVHEQPYTYEPDENYALVIRNNDIKRTADDGIEVIGSGEIEGPVSKLGASGLISEDQSDDEPTRYYYGITDRVLVAENKIRETGYYENEDRIVERGEEGRENGYNNVGEDGYGHDGIHVRNVTGTFYEDVAQKKAPGGSYNAYNNFYGYAVDIVKNDVRKTGDDGIEVYNSESTLIVNNTVRKAGVFDDYEGPVSKFGARGIGKRGGFGNNTDGADYYGADGIHVRNVGGSNPDYGTDGYASGDDFEPYSVAIVNNDVRKTADDGIEVIGETEFNDYGWNDYGFGTASTNDLWDDYSYGFNGTGRTLILENTIRNAGTSGNYGSESGSSYDSRYPEDSYSYDYEYGNRGSYDGYGGDGISVRGVGVIREDHNDDDIRPTSAGNAGGPIGGSDYTVQIIGNDVAKTGDDGIEVVGDERFEDYGFGGGSFTGRVLVAGNMVEKAGLSGGSYSNNYNSGNGTDEGGFYYYGNSSYNNSYYGNAGDDGYGADGIHVRGISTTEAYNDDPIIWTANALPGNDGRNYGGYAVDVVGNDVKKTGDDGIEVRNSDSTFIAGNTVNKAGSLSNSYSTYDEGSYSSEDSYSYGDYGFGSFSGGNSGRKGNYSGGDGIHVENVRSDNELVLKGGIEVDGEFEQYDVVIYRNKVKNSSDDGIEVDTAGRTRIEKNRVKNSGTASYEGSYSEYEDYGRDGSSNSNFSNGASAFDGRGSDGIHVNDVNDDFVTVFVPSEAEATEINDSEGGLYILQPVNSVEIVGNKVNNSGDDGIQVIDSGDTLIGGENLRLNKDDELVNRDANIVTNSGTAESYGDYGLGGGGPINAITSDTSEDDDNGSFSDYGFYSSTGSIDATGGDGINVSNPNANGYNVFDGLDGPSVNVRIIGNTVEESADDSIEVIASADYGFGSKIYDGFGHTTNVLIDKNDIDVSGDNGIALVTGGGFFISDRDDRVSQVEFYSPYGTGRMNSEVTENTVDDSGNNGLVAEGYNHDKVILAGNEFTNNPTGARFESGEIDLTGETNTFTVTPDFEAPEGFDFVTGLQFELAGAVSSPTSLTIKDETLGTTSFQGFLSRPENSAFYVRFEDGAITDEFGNAIEIEAMSTNFDRIVPNNVPGFPFNSPQLLDIEARIFDVDDSPNRGQIFVNLGSPLNPEDFLQERGFGQFGTSGLDVTVTGLPAINGAGLNNIQPAAGEGEGGETGEDLASIEPAAGGEDAACWGDAIDAASTGAPVNYSYGGTFEESLNDASVCNTTFQ